MELLTVGHGTLAQDAFVDVLRAGGVESLVDVRMAPGSRRHPHFAREAMEQWLPGAGIAYRWERRLGGWRKPDASSPNTALRNDSFRGYADYLVTPPFWGALDAVLEEASVRRTVVCCSESLLWRCHRRLIADAAMIGRQASVVHLGQDGSLTPHRLTDGVRSADGQPIYDVGMDRPLPGFEPGG